MHAVSGWRDCIVVLIDLVGIKGWALNGDPRASASMRSFHNLVRREMSGADALDHAYVWNDSALFLAYVDDRRTETYKRAIRAADNLKRKIDELAPSYAIAVKGRAFPLDFDLDDSKVTVIKASSYAMANCFKIEAEAKKKRLRAAWYVDSRIAKKVHAVRSAKSLWVPLLPNRQARRIYLHDKHLWNVSDTQ